MITKKIIVEFRKRGFNDEQIAKKLSVTAREIFQIRTEDTPSRVYGLSSGRDNFRESIRERDNFTCQFPGCGKKWKEGARRFDVHHLDETIARVIPSRKIPIAYDRSHPEKLITFCHKCHFKWHIERGHQMNGRKGHINEKGVHMALTI